MEGEESNSDFHPRGMALNVHGTILVIFIKIGLCNWTG